MIKDEPMFFKTPEILCEDEKMNLLCQGLRKRLLSQQSLQESLDSGDVAVPQLDTPGLSLYLIGHIPDIHIIHTILYFKK